MSHEIKELDCPAFVKQAAWHGLGTIIQDLMEARNVLPTAKMDYHVDKVPLYRQYIVDGATQYILVPDHTLTVRCDLPPTDVRSQLGVVGDGYTVVQNAELVDFAEALAGESGAKFETAGTLRNGKLVWLLAVMPDTLKVGGDNIKPYLLLHNGHDGSAAFSVRATTVRVVCWNTLSAAVGDQNYTYMVRHTANIAEKIGECKAALSRTAEYNNALLETLNQFSRRRCERRFVEAFISALVPGDEKHVTKSKGETITQCGRKRNELRDLILNGQQIGADSPEMLVDGEPTAYALYNGFTQWTETKAQIRRTTDNTGEQRSEAEARMDSVLFGTHAVRRDLAMHVLRVGTGLEKPSEAFDSLADEAKLVLATGGTLN